jgi:2-polyprenyl-6-methoxyphenol hydroxylase-like FAD-dependent oxidoreductase
MTGPDVVVVGGRVAGAATAMLLARAGVRVTVLERAAYGSDTLSTHALMRAGVMQLSRWGLLDAVVASGAPAVRRTLFHYGDEESVEVSIRPGGGVDALYAPRRHVLDRILVDAAAEAGADVRHRTTVTGLLRGPADRVEGVVTRDARGRVEEVRAPLTIGADGIRSLVAAATHAAVERPGRHAGAVLYRYVAGVDAAGYEWSYGAQGMAGLIPTHDGACVVFVGTEPGRLQALRRREGVDGAFRSLLATAGPALFARVDAGLVVSRTHGWAGVTGYLRRSHGPGWALVGDAGYFKDPATAHGITDALRDAELLARAVVQAPEGRAPAAAALREYQATRDRLSAALFAATEKVAAFAWDLEEVRGVLRHVNSAMSDEVDHLKALPDLPVRPAGPALSRFIPADTEGGASVA